MYFTSLALPLRVNLNSLPAVMSFLLITESTPISSARWMYSMFSTSAMVFSTPNFFATTHARTLASSFPVRARKASYSLMPSSARSSELRPSPTTKITLSGSLSERAMALSLSFSRILTRLTFLLNWSAASSAILEPPSIITLSVSMLLLPRYFIRNFMPSRVAMMNTRSWYMSFVSNLGIMV